MNLHSNVRATTSATLTKEYPTKSEMPDVLCLREKDEVFLIGRWSVIKKLQTKKKMKI